MLLLAVYSRMSSNTVSYMFPVPPCVLRAHPIEYLFSASSAITSRDGATNFKVTFCPNCWQCTFSPNWWRHVTHERNLNAIYCRSWQNDLRPSGSSRRIESVPEERRSRFTSRRKPGITHNLKRFHDSTFRNTIYWPFLTSAFPYLLPVFLRVDWPSRHSQDVQLI